MPKVESKPCSLSIANVNSVRHSMNNCSDSCLGRVFAIVLNPTSPLTTTCTPNDDAVAVVPRKKFPPSLRLEFGRKVARRNHPVIPYSSLPTTMPNTYGMSSHNGSV